ncbi:MULTISPECIES: helix-turn-helix domain-containing protein [Roseomonadaceae]|uniref:Helix-turn-helix domain-containing protein n=1 Tax=Falsiroseomonas oleicola TaxID=2801474 RepID=A0ABS6H6W7_9PROT|nr:helix-turn-helix domain-containing protein [Roseomonas oleicola]MBU8543488.1 helix-turn-helix domain-containing protein [Roseomonas oleicola]
MADDREGFGAGLVEALQEVRDWQQGRGALHVVNRNPMPPERIRTIRKRLAKTARAFEEKFGIPAATLNNWEQGRRAPDPAARLLLEVMEREPEAVERAVAATTPR